VFSGQAVGRPSGGMAMRCIGVLGMVLALFSVGLASDAAAASKSKKKPLPKAAKVSMLLGVNKRDRVLLTGIQVKVKADRAVKVKVAVAGGLTGKARTVTFKKRGTITTTFKLSTAGRTKFEACGNGNVPLKVTSSFLVPKKGSRTKKVTKKVNASLAVKWTGPGCTVTPPAAVTKCDPIDPARCMLPFPNNYFTRPDATSATGLRINFEQAAMPADKNGVHIDPTEWNRNDGFSPGQSITATVPGLDNQAAFDQSGIVPITNMADYARADQPVVVINATTGARQLIWAEMDSSAGSPANTSLIIRPGKNWQEGQRYIVALRNLKKADGSAITASPGFRAYRDNQIPASANKVIKDRKPAMEDIFAKLGAAGIARGDLDLAWDFTVASAGNIAGRMLAIRNDAFAQLGDTDLANQTVEGHAPAFTATATDYSPAEDSQFARKVSGTFQVPCYLTSPGCAQGGTFNYAAGDTSADRLPVQNGTFTASYTCRIPRDTEGGDIVTGARGVIYGHGLLGSQNEVGQGQISDMSFAHKTIYCATDWYGMASSDIGTVAGILNNLGLFPRLADRVQQGMLAFLYMGRLLAAPAAQGGFASSPAFQNGSGTPVNQAAGRIYYDGNSQGGIIGGAVVAVSPDLDRGTLGVLGMNYSTLLQRSTDFSNYAKVLYGAYPDTLDRQLYLSMMQMLWDRAESNGYAEHMTTNPYPNTPPHEVLLHAAFGDHQVANVTALVEARTIGAKVYTPDGVAGHALDPGRWNPVADPFLGIDPIPSFPYTGSALVMFDSGPLRDGGAKGTNYSPLTNVAPTDADGNDPHEFPRRTAIGQQMKSDFYAPGGQVTKACGATTPCYSDGFTGNP